MRDMEVRSVEARSTKARNAGIRSLMPKADRRATHRDGKTSDQPRTGEPPGELRDFRRARAGAPGKRRQKYSSARPAPSRRGAGESPAACGKIATEPCRSRQRRQLEPDPGPCLIRHQRLIQDFTQKLEPKTSPRTSSAISPTRSIPDRHLNSTLSASSVEEARDDGQ